MESLAEVIKVIAIMIFCAGAFSGAILNYFFGLNVWWAYLLATGGLGVIFVLIAIFLVRLN